MKHAQPANLVTIAVSLVSPAANPTMPPDIEHRFIRMENPPAHHLNAALALDGAVLTVTNPSFVYRLNSEDACEAHYHAFAFAVDSGLLPEAQAFDLVDAVEKTLPLLVSNDANHLFASRWFDRATALMNSEPPPFPKASESGSCTRTLEPKASDLDRLKRGAYDAADADIFYQRRSAALRTLLGISVPTGEESASGVKQREQRDNDNLYVALLDGLRNGVVDVEYWLDAERLEVGVISYALGDLLALLPAMYGNAAFDPDATLAATDAELWQAARKWARAELSALEAARKADLEELKRRSKNRETSERLERTETGAEKPGTPARYLSGRLWCAQHMGVATTLELDELTTAFTLVF